MHCLVVFGRPVIVFRLSGMSPRLVTKVGSNNVNLDKWTEHTCKSSDDRNDQSISENGKHGVDNFH